MAIFSLSLTEPFGHLTVMTIQSWEVVSRQFRGAIICTHLLCTGPSLWTIDELRPVVQGFSMAESMVKSHPIIQRYVFAPLFSKVLLTVGVNLPTASMY